MAGQISNNAFKITPGGVSDEPPDAPVGNGTGDMDPAMDDGPTGGGSDEPDEYAIQFPDCDINLADVNADGSVTAFDIEPFLGLLFP